MKRGDCPSLIRPEQLRCRERGQDDLPRTFSVTGFRFGTPLTQAYAVAEAVAVFEADGVGAVIGHGVEEAAAEHYAVVRFGVAGMSKLFTAQR